MSEMFNIVKDHPIPPIVRARAATPRKKYPVDKMDVGDSFFVADRTVRRVSAYISRITKNLQGTFETRPGHGIENDGKWLPAEAEAPGTTKGTWVWRTA